MSSNKKVLNATAVSEDGIDFRSKAERTFYQLIKNTDLDFQYEPKALILLDGFYPKVWYEGTKEHKEKVRNMTYTPDFIIKSKGHMFLIEIKGLCTDRYIVKRKLLLDKLKNESHIHFFEVHTKKDMLFCIDKIKNYDNSNKEDKITG